ncbi:MAG: SDR family oxidoreductase [Trueperaceae bacterium]|nr:SDR family oxidoreductase [Trueperaceae bacterium]
MGKILVTGATGYIGGRLIPRLLEQGRELRCLVRDVARMQVKEWRDDVEMIEGDVLEPDTLPAVFEGVDTAYYLIHSMSSTEAGFEDRDRVAARNFAEAAERAGVKHIIYLGGLGDTDKGMSSHLASRQETGHELASTGVATTEFRAAIIVGSGSISFEMIRYLTERLPIMVTPKWVDTKVQPIAIRDVLSYLLQAPEIVPEGHQIVEIGGPEVLCYRDMMMTYADIRGLKRRMIPTTVLSPRMSSYWINIVTPIPASIARPLVEGLTSEVIVDNPEPAQQYQVRLISYETAVKLALDRTSQGAVETLWSGALAAVPRGTPSAEKLQVQDTQGMLVDRQVREFEVSPSSAYAAIVRIGGEEGWYTFDWLWQLRGVLDRIWGGIGMRRGRRDPKDLLPGDALDFWRVESVETNDHLQLRAEMKVPGRAWLRFDIEPVDGGKTQIRQTAFFEPHGLMGYLYWWAVYPLHLFIFPSMIRAVGRRAQEYDDGEGQPITVASHQTETTSSR